MARDFDILAAIDLRGGRVVRLEQGDFARETAFSDDPVATAVSFADAGARWLHVVDLDAARDGQPVHQRVVAAIVAAVGDRVHVEVAGGLRSASVVQRAFDDGAARVVIGSAALRDPSFIGGLIERHGAARVAVAIDVRDGAAVGEGWRPGAPGRPVDATMTTLMAQGVDIFEITAIDRDGRMQGPDLKLYERALAMSAGQVIASAGVRDVADVVALRDIGCAGAIIGRALYDGRLSIADVIDG